MKFIRGSKVEVMNRREFPISWCSAEILSGNGRNYTVKFDGFPGMTSKATAEDVSKYMIRPCPPPVEGAENIVAGDIVEVFLEFSWKIASILNVLPREQYLIRLLGCSKEFCIHKSKLRIRQSWQDNKWILMRKGSRGHGVVKSGKLLTPHPHKESSFQVPKVCPLRPGKTGLQESRIVSSRSRKRISPYSSSIIESPTRHTQKRRAIEKDGSRERANVAPVVVKVDAVAYRREIKESEHYVLLADSRDISRCSSTWPQLEPCISWFQSIKMMPGLAALLLAKVRQYVQLLSCS